MISASSVPKPHGDALLTLLEVQLARVCPCLPKSSDSQVARLAAEIVLAPTLAQVAKRNETPWVGLLNSRLAWTGPFFVRVANT